MQSVTAPAITRTVEKLAASMECEPSAARHNRELAANAISAAHVSNAIREGEEAPATLALLPYAPQRPQRLSSLRAQTIARSLIQAQSCTPCNSGEIAC